MVTSRSRRIKVIPPSPEQEPDIDQIDSDEVDELEDLSDEDMLEDDDEMDPSDTSGLLDENEEELEDDLAEDIEDEEDEEEVIQPSSKSRSKRKKAQVASASDDEELDSDLEILRNQPMTKRQRAKHNKEEPEEYLELPMETGKKRQFTEEEAALRKSEVARRRKNQSIQRAEKDKQDTINRLLKKQASKSKKTIKDDGTPDGQSPADRLQQIQDPFRLRYVQNQQGSTLTIPQKYSVNQVFFGQDDAIPNTDTTSNTSRMTRCQVEGCQGTRKYVAKKSGKVACSYDHYKLVEI